MKISVFGLGYVGAVTAGCLAELGHTVIGADVQQAKVDAFNAGTSPIIEPELDGLLAKAKAKGRLRATMDGDVAVRETDLTIICVGTPSLESGRLNLEFVKKVSEQVAAAIRSKGRPHEVLYRSTMLPGSTRMLWTEYFAEPGLAEFVRVHYCPEFLREGSAVADFREPSLTVIGTQSGDAAGSEQVMSLFQAKAEVLGWEGAEMIKYACNYFHALKVGFANEIGRVCKHLGEDGKRVMDVVCEDTRLNISRHYLRPGNPFGGSCLPKDLSALKSFARVEDISLPLLEGTLDTNRAHLETLLRIIAGKQKQRIGILGLAFKADTDDLRGSPMVAVAEALLGRGHELHIYDPQLNLTRLIGTNASEIHRRMPHLASLLRGSAREVVDASDLIVVSQKCARAEDLIAGSKADQCLIDINGWSELKAGAWAYEGLCW